MRIATIEELATVVRGSSPRPSGDPRYYGGEIPRLMVSDVTRDGMYVTPKIDFLTTEGAAKSRPMLKGDLIIAVSGDPGEPCILNVDACIHDGFVGFREMDFNQVDTPYLYHFFKLIKQTNKDQAVGAIYKNLNTDQIKKIKIPLPPLPVQQKIAAILDAADELRQKDKALLAKYEELTQALFLDMFGDPVSNPKGWEKKPLKQFGNIITGNTPSRSEQDNYSLQGIEWIKTDNISENNLYVSSASECLSEKGLKKARFVDKGGVLVACIAGSIESIGRAALTDRKVSFNQQINAIYPNANIDSNFLYYQFRFSKKHIQNHASSGMKRMLSKGEFEKILMIWPPINLQNQFAERVKAIEAQKAIAQASAVKSEELFNSLLQKAFNGELV